MKKQWNTNYSWGNKGSLEMLNPCTEEYLAWAGVGLVTVACFLFSATCTPCLHLLASDVVIWVWTLPSAENKEHKRGSDTASILNVGRNTCILFAFTPGVVIFIHSPHFLFLYWFFNDNSVRIFFCSLLSLHHLLSHSSSRQRSASCNFFGGRLFIS